MIEKIPQLIIVRGIPGSGKSTFAKKMFPDYYHLESDMYFMTKDGFYAWRADRLSDAHEWCQIQTKIRLLRGENVIVTNTFTQNRFLQPYIKIAVDNNIQFEIYRMENRYMNIHSVPLKTVANMIKRFENVPYEKIVIGDMIL